MIVSVPDMSLRAAGTKDEESSSSRVPELFSLVMSECNASGRARLMPIPIAAVLGFFGIIATSLFAEPIVNLSSDIGNAIIFGENAGADEKERISNVYKYAKEYDITILLKGQTDIISDGDRVAINKIHNCAMSVGGTGDILSGLTAGILTKMKSYEASILGVYFNGLAGNLAYDQVGLHMVATDLLEHIPKAMKPFDLVQE